MTKLISIVIPTYNRVDKLTNLLKSVLANDYKNIEILVIDDNSDDETVEKISRLYPDRVKMYTNNSNKGVAYARNIGINEANGEYIFLIDDDNVLDRSCISQIIKAYTDNPDAVMVGPIMRYKKSKKIWWAGTKRSMLTSKTIFQKFLPEELYWETDDFPNAWSFRAKYKKSAYFDEDFYIHYEESDFAYRLKKNVDGKFIVAKKAITYHDIDSEMMNDKLRRWNNPKRVFYTARNRKLFHKRYSTRLEYFVFIVVFNNLFTLYYIKFIWKIDMGRKSNNLKNIASYIRGSVL